MKTILVLLAFFFFLFGGGKGFFFLKILKETPRGLQHYQRGGEGHGVVVQGGLVLTERQLAHVIERRNPAHSMLRKRNQRWDTYLLHIKYENVSTEQVVLDGTMVKKIQKMVTEERKTFNPFSSALSSMCSLWLPCTGTVSRVKVSPLATLATIFGAVGAPSSRAGVAIAPTASRHRHPRRLAATITHRPRRRR